MTVLIYLLKHVSNMLDILHLAYTVCTLLSIPRIIATKPFFLFLYVAKLLSLKMLEKAKHF